MYMCTHSRVMKLVNRSPLSKRESDKPHMNKESTYHIFLSSSDRDFIRCLLSDYEVCVLLYTDLSSLPKPRGFNHQFLLWSLILNFKSQFFLPAIHFFLLLKGVFN